MLSDCRVDQRASIVARHTFYAGYWSGTWLNEHFLDPLTWGTPGHWLSPEGPVRSWIRGAGQDLKQIRQVARRFGIDERDFGDWIEEEKLCGEGGELNERGDFTWEELVKKAQEYSDLFGPKKRRR